MKKTIGCLTISILLSACSNITQVDSPNVKKIVTSQPNVVLVLADDMSWFDVGAYHRQFDYAPKNAITPNLHLAPGSSNRALERIGGGRGGRGGEGGGGGGGGGGRGGGGGGRGGGEGEGRVG